MADTRKVRPASRDSQASLTSEAQTFEGFFSACAKSGPAGCAFAIDNSTAEELEDRYHDLLEKLRQEPLPVSHSDVGPGILSPSDVEYTVFHALYAPSTWCAPLLLPCSASNLTTAARQAEPGAPSRRD